MKLNHYDHAEIMGRIHLYAEEQDYIALERLKENNPKLVDDIQGYYNRCCTDIANKAQGRALVTVAIVFCIFVLAMFISVWATTPK